MAWIPVPALADWIECCTAVAVLAKYFMTGSRGVDGPALCWAERCEWTPGDRVPPVRLRRVRHRDSGFPMPCI